jgi:hypothetical protein
LSKPHRAAAAGVAIALLYAASAHVSARLSPSAARPLLDGLAPPQSYLWVDPPAALESSNLQPAPAHARLGMTPSGSPSYVLTTADAQATLILPVGTLPPTQDQTDVELSVVPLAATEVSAPEPPLQILGNVYRFQATYLPSGEAAGSFEEPVDAVLVYPRAANDHGSHQLLFSVDGITWTALDTNDTPSVPQADATIDRPGYLAVAGQVQPVFTQSGSASVLRQAIALAVIVGIAFLAVTIFERRRRSRGGSQQT